MIFITFIEEEFRFSTHFQLVTSTWRLHLSGSLWNRETLQTQMRLHLCAWRHIPSS